MELTIRDLKDLFTCSQKNNNPFEDLKGKNVFVRTVTYHYTGKVENVTGSFVKLSHVAWIADSGRFYDALKKEEFDEVEPFVSPIFLNIESIIDFTEISKLSESQR
jgi:hypothetical protein